MWIGKNIDHMVQKREKALTRVIAAIILMIVVIAAVAIYFAAISPRRSTSPSTVQVTIPSGADTQPSDWNQSHIVSNSYFSPNTTPL